MSTFGKILSPILLAALLLAVAVSGRAQDNGSSGDGAAVVDLPPEAKRDLEEAANRDDTPGTDEDPAVAEPDRGPVPSAALEEPEDSLLPVVPPMSRYEEIWKNSPFELEAAPDVVSTAKQSFAKDYALSGMLKQGDETVVYIINRKTKETHKVTKDGGGEGGFKLLSLEGASNNVRDVEATIEKGGEEARLTYDKALMSSAAGAAMKNHPRSQQNLANTQNPRVGANDPQDRSAAAAAARARQTELAARTGGGSARTTGGGGSMGSQASNGTSAGGAQTGRKGAPQTPAGRRRIVLPKPPAPQPETK